MSGVDMVGFAGHALHLQRRMVNVEALLQRSGEGKAHLVGIHLAVAKHDMGRQDGFLGSQCPRMQVMYLADLGV